MIELLHLITAFASIVAAIISWKVKSHVQQIHLEINSRLDSLLQLTKKSSFAEGVLSETSKTPGA